MDEKARVTSLSVIGIEIEDAGKFIDLSRLEFESTPKIE